MLRKTVEDFVSETVAREGDDRVVVQGNFLGDLRSVFPMCGDCVRDKDRSKRSCLCFLGKLTGHIQGAFGVVEHRFCGIIEELDTVSL